MTVASVPGVASGAERSMSFGTIATGYDRLLAWDQVKAAGGARIQPGEALASRSSRYAKALPHPLLLPGSQERLNQPP